MSVDFQVLFNIAVLIIGGLGGWVLKTLADELRWLKNNDSTLSEKLQRMEVLVAGTYVKREDLDRLTEAIFNKLDRIELKIDGKADKP